MYINLELCCFYLMTLSLEKFDSNEEAVYMLQCMHVFIKFKV